MRAPILVVALLLTGCGEEQRPQVIVTAAPDAETTKLSKVSAAVTQARRDNTLNPEGRPKQAVDLQLSVAQAGLPPAGAGDLEHASDTSALVFAGKLEEAIQRATTAERDLAELTAQVARERAESESRTRAIVDDAERRVREAEEKSRREAYVRVVSIFAVIGGAIVLAGIACALTGWNRIGVLGIPGGILIGGSGLLWGQPWFIWTVGAGVVLCAVGAGIFWAVRVFESRDPNSN